MTNAEPYFLIASEAERELKNLSKSEVKALKEAIDEIRTEGSLPTEIPEQIEDQGYTMATAGDVTLVYRSLSEDEAVQQGREPSVPGYVLMDLFKTTEQIANSERRRGDRPSMEKS